MAALIVALVEKDDKEGVEIPPRETFGADIDGMDDLIALETTLDAAAGALETAALVVVTVETADVTIVGADTVGILIDKGILIGSS